MRRSYLDYAMSVIVSRALPDARDGLKPVHRRILYSMNEQGCDWNKPFRKSARIVGDVMGKYHPHGGEAIYDAMVRMVQDFAMRLMLIDGQGNFGSMDGDPAAAMRYTEARMAKSAHALLEDIDKETVDFQPNYDDTAREPVVLPARLPNLLVNGAGGIAVGMATNIPPHNLGEVIDACRAYIENPDIDIDELIEYVPAPDFPTGGLILGRAGARAAYHYGRGTVVMRSRTHIEPVGRDREAIVATEIPYQVNKSRMIERIAEVVREKRVEGISELRDESDRDGVRVVIELRRDAVAEVVLNQLFHFTPLQTSFGINILALDHGKPRMMNLKELIASFVSFREEVITRRTVYDLARARERAHVLVGLALAVANLDELIALIRGAPDPATARAELIARPWPAGDVAPLIELIAEIGRDAADGNYHLSEVQAKAILDLRLHRLTGLEREKIADELNSVCQRIDELLGILASGEKVREIMRGELEDMREQFADNRRTEVVDVEFEQDIEDLIKREDMVVSVSHGGYIKRVPLTAYRSQRRGGKGRSGMATREEDFVAQVFIANTHTPVLFFSTSGLVYRLKVYRLPLGTPQARGKALVNLLPLAEGQTISTVMPMPDDESQWSALYVMFATSKGSVRRNALSDFTNIKSNGKVAMKLDPGDRLVGVQTCSETQDILLATRDGKCVRFPVTDIRVFSGRTSTGVRGAKLLRHDSVISMSILDHVTLDVERRDQYLKFALAKRRAATGEIGDPEESTDGDGDSDGEGLAVDIGADEVSAIEEAEEFILTIRESGFGKRSSSYEYRTTNRGGTGVANTETPLRHGTVVAAFPVAENDQIVLMTDGGQLLRCSVNDIRIGSRNMQGVRLLRVAEGERVVSVAHLADAGESDDDDDGEPSEEEAGDDNVSDGEIASEPNESGDE